MTSLRIIAIALLAATSLGGAAQAQDQSEPLKIGVISTLSGPGAVLGEQARDGFLLAVEEMGGSLGGREVEVVVVDDEQKPDVAVNRAREMVEREGVEIVVGTIFSNIQNAITTPLTEAGVFVLSPNAGPSTLAGADCNENFFAVSYQNDQNHEVLGAYAKNQGFARVFLMAPNYQAGQDALAGFKHSYDEGEVVEEVYTPLGQLDFSAELAQIAAAQPDAVYSFMPGGMGVNLVKQYRQSGLESIPFLSAFTVDETNLPAQGADAVGSLSGSNWAPDMDNEASLAFVAAYEAKYGTVPGSYAMHGYDSALLIASAIEAVGGDLSDKDAMRAALEAADFQSLRGDFAFGDNHFPIQDFYLVEVAEREDGKFQTQISETIFEDYTDNYAGECQMN